LPEIPEPHAEIPAPSAKKAPSARMGRLNFTSPRWYREPALGAEAGGGYASFTPPRA
jgi:hypothetical protein